MWLVERLERRLTGAGGLVASPEGGSRSDGRQQGEKYWAGLRESRARNDSTRPRAQQPCLNTQVVKIRAFALG